MKHLSAVLVLGMSAIVSALAAGYLFVSATATASLRFGYCGPSSLDHLDPACSIATKLLYASFGIAALALLLAVLTLWVYTRHLKSAPVTPENSTLGP